MSLGLAIALLAEATSPEVAPITRTVWMVITAAFIIVLLGGVWRLLVVCLIVNESDILVRNFRGDIHYRPSEIRGVRRASDFAGFGVALQLKTGEEMRLDGLAWMTAARTDQAVAEISKALGLEPVEKPANAG